MHKNGLVHQCSVIFSQFWFKEIDNELLEGIRQWKYKKELVKQRHRMSYTAIMLKGVNSH